jgi:putative PIN family toxin of toxin-antitoxin system
MDFVRLHGLILLSEGTRGELEDVLHRPKFERYVTPEERMAFLRLVVAASRMVAVSEHIAVCRDPRDDQFLEVAAAGHATCIVSGDDDLRVLKEFRGIEVFSAVAFLEKYRPSV